MPRILGGLVVAVIVLAGAPPASAAPGDLDTTFGGDGIALTGPQDLDEFTSDFDVAVQSDGKVVVAGNDAFGALVARFGAGGELDPGFGDGGIATFEFSPSEDTSVHAVGIDSLGRLLVGGDASVDGLAVARLTPDGDLDPTFSGDGRALIQAGALPTVEDLVVDGSNRVVVAGWSRACPRRPSCLGPQGSRFVIARLTAGGVPDSSFSGDGIRALQPTGYDAGHAVGLAPDGRILVAGGIAPDADPGFGDSRGVVLRLWPGGALDGSYGRGGYAVIGVREVAINLRELAVGGDGSVAVTGGSATFAGRNRIIVARLRANGRFDRDFSDDGKLFQDLGRGAEGGSGVVIDGEGRILVGGTMRIEANARGVVLRHLPNGSLDPAFSGNGWVPVDPTPQEDASEGLAVDPDGRAVLGLGTPDRIGAARVLTT